MTRAPLTADEVVKAVIDLYLEHGKDHTIKEIAAKLDRSESAVRKVMAEHHGCPDELGMHTAYRDSRSKSYTMMITGTHRVYEYGPHRATLRKLLINDK